VESLWAKPAGYGKSIREFLAFLRERGQLATIDVPVSPALELTEISRRVLAEDGPALLFTQTSASGIRVLTNLFGSTQRIAWALGADDVNALSDLGSVLAALRQPEPPRGVSELWDKLPILRDLLRMAPKTVRDAPCQEVSIGPDDVDLTAWPIQTCWPEDAGPLITWGLTTTRGPDSARQNLGVYRQQIIGRNRIIMRWLALGEHCSRSRNDAGGRYTNSKYVIGVCVRRPAAR
jgi:4-hydroxy-3-polyprenylbenzoate decarboxylase